MNSQSLLCGILFCISIAALIIACLAFTKKGGEYYKDITESMGAAYDALEPHMKAKYKRPPTKGSGPLSCWPKGTFNLFCAHPSKCCNGCDFMDMVCM